MLALVSFVESLCFGQQFAHLIQSPAGNLFVVGTTEAALAPVYFPRDFEPKVMKPSFQGIALLAACGHNLALSGELASMQERADVATQGLRRPR